MNEKQASEMMAADAVANRNEEKQNAMKATYPIGTMFTAPNGKFMIVDYRLGTLRLRSESGAEQGIDVTIIEKALAAGTMARA